jgi:hypothetical protein
MADNDIVMVRTVGKPLIIVSTTDHCANSLMWRMDHRQAIPKSQGPTELNLAIVYRERG